MMRRSLGRDTASASVWRFVFDVAGTLCYTEQALFKEVEKTGFLVYLGPNKRRLSRSVGQMLFWIVATFGLVDQGAWEPVGQACQPVRLSREQGFDSACGSSDASQNRHSAEQP